MDLAQVWVSSLEKCKVCIEKTKKNNFCSLHNSAYQNIHERFNQWEVAYSNKITFQDYLKKLRTLPETGRAVQDVLEYLLKSKDRDID